MEITQKDAINKVSASKKVSDDLSAATTHE